VPGRREGRGRAKRPSRSERYARTRKAGGQAAVRKAEQAIEIVQACQTLARAAREAVIFAFDYAGASVIHARMPLQRRLRDIFAGLKHAAFTPAFLSLIGKRQLGLPYARTIL